MSRDALLAPRTRDQIQKRVKRRGQLCGCFRAPPAQLAQGSLGHVLELAGWQDLFGCHDRREHRARGGQPNRSVHRRHAPDTEARGPRVRPRTAAGRPCGIPGNDPAQTRGCPGLAPDGPIDSAIHPSQCFRNGRFLINPLSVSVLVCARL